jgi:hypothetical protein
MTTDTVPLNVTWGKEMITIDFVVAGGVKGLKTELEEKTSVPADRQKVMAKSKGAWGRGVAILLEQQKIQNNA